MLTLRICNHIVVVVNQCYKVLVHVHLVVNYLAFFNVKVYCHLLVDDALALIHWWQLVLVTETYIFFNLGVHEHKATLVVKIFSKLVGFLGVRQQILTIIRCFKLRLVVVIHELFIILLAHVSIV